jgi:hypothetical protein
MAEIDVHCQSLSFIFIGAVGHEAASKLLHLLFGVLRISGTLMEWNRRNSQDCPELF